MHLYVCLFVQMVSTGIALQSICCFVKYVVRNRSGAYHLDEVLGQELAVWWF